MQVVRDIDSVVDDAGALGRRDRRLRRRQVGLDRLDPLVDPDDPASETYAGEIPASAATSAMVVARKPPCAKVRTALATTTARRCSAVERTRSLTM